MTVTRLVGMRSRTIGRGLPGTLCASCAVAVWVLGATPVTAQRVGGQPGSGVDVLRIVPFENISQTPSDDWIGTGIIETVAVQLHGIATVDVVAAGPVGGAGGIDDERRLGARWLVTGGYQRVEDQLHITLRLVDVRTGDIVRSAKIDGAIADLFGLQDRLSAAIINGVVQNPGRPSRRPETAARSTVMPTPAMQPVRLSPPRQVLGGPDLAHTSEIPSGRRLNDLALATWQPQLRGATAFHASDRVGMSMVGSNAFLGQSRTPPLGVTVFAASDAQLRGATPPQPEGRTQAPRLASQVPPTVGTAGRRPFSGSAPEGEATDTVLRLTISDAVARALRANIDLLNGQHRVAEARADYTRANSRLLPHVTTRTAMSAQQINLAAFGFTAFPNTPDVVGPFGIFDSRVFFSQSLLDFDALHNRRAEGLEVDIARLDANETRRLVVLATGNLYWQGVTAAARIEAAQSQLDTATALHRLARDLKQAGMVAGIEVLRAELQRDAARQRVIDAEHDFEKRKLLLARTIGLPLGQRIVLTDSVPSRPLDDINLDAALAEAFASRQDYQAAMARVEAATAKRRAAAGERLPVVDVTADFGTNGRTPTQDAHGTFSFVGSVRVPIFQGGRVGAAIAEADARLRRARDELDSFRGQVEYDVRAALLDLTVAAERVRLAERSVDLATQELEQARNRFAAGLTSNIEVIEAQSAVATATDNHLGGVYAYNVATGALAHAIGTTEVSMIRTLGELQ
jgi:outer membrane protein TolC/TolB-like protein